MRTEIQAGILAPVAAHARSLSFRLTLGTDVREALATLALGFDPAWGVAGLGEPLLLAVGKTIPGLRTFPALSTPAGGIPSTQQALWVLLQADSPTTLFQHAQALNDVLREHWELADAQDTFLYGGGRDLTGYEDGTENPQDDEAVATAILGDDSPLAGSSFVAVQRWAHDLRHFARHSPAERDAMIGRERDSNEELDDAPDSAHVKRTAQEDYTPPAFMVRRSMPWASADAQGLEFVAFARTLDAFENVLRRMSGLVDGITDALFRFSRPLTGGYYWCPALHDGKLDLSPLNLN